MSDPISQRPLKILFTEGSSTSARQCLYALGRLGHTIDICDPSPFCLGRFSRYVRAWYRCPGFASEPASYMRFLSDRLERGRYDVLFPVHDQIYLLARFTAVLERSASVAFPPVAALERIQSKAAFVRLLDQLSLAHPATVIVPSADELNGPRDLPCYVKLAYGTAGAGVWFVRSRSDWERLAAELKNCRDVSRQELLVQQPATGTWSVTQSVFRKGELVAAHSYEARAIGVGGSARCRESVSHAVVERDLARLGAHLGWHGALHIEYFMDPNSQQPVYIEANPRIGETMNATLSGTNLCGVLVQVSQDAPVPCVPQSRIGTRTHNLLTSLLAVADGGRRALVRELCAAWRARGLYQNSQEEMSRASEDWMSVIPLAAVICELLIAPGRAHRIVGGNVHRNALTAHAAYTIQGLDPSAVSRPL